MYHYKIEKNYSRPVECGLDLFSGKWKIRIICSINEEPHLRYGTLRKKINNISDTVLASTLKELISDGLVVRKQFEEIPLRVEYDLTEKGASAIPLIRSICEWTMKYHKEADETMLPKCRNCPYCNLPADSAKLS